MTNDVINQNETFQLTYSAKQQEEIKIIRNKYLPKQESKMEELIRLDKQTEKRGQIISISIGILGTLLFGVGMCCTMVWNINMIIFVAGVVIGIIGLVMMGFAYPINKKVTEKERAKIRDRIIELTNELSL